MKRYATLREAVKASVNSGIDGAVFSVFDITQMLRNGCNYGNIVIEECQTSYPTFTVDFKKNVKYHYDISHSAVRTNFYNLYDCGELDIVAYSMAGPAGGQYRTYVKKNSLTSAVTSTSNPASVIPATSFNTAVQATTKVASTPSDINGRIFTYLLNKKNAGKTVTLKQVQSAIKRDTTTGLTCSQIRDVILRSPALCNYFSVIKK
jgi:hypothetical protein